MRRSGESWRGAWERMFLRYRDHVRAEVREGRRPYLSDEKIDTLARAQAHRSVEQAINAEADHGEQRRKQRTGQAA